MAKWREDFSTNELTFNQYQENAAKTAIYPQEKAIEYLSLGLVAEAGEFAGKIAKFYRKDKLIGMITEQQSVIDELGDILWFISEFSRLMGQPLSTIADNNTTKLASRAERGQLKGDGDNR
jgi:NTP pyrophosphatase (non-canonical NTP hydrolase)|tara:strand:+ start:147 stop:509 length:363 start_codon:yes stop_codon:yes gene_type:complete